MYKVHIQDDPALLGKRLYIVDVDQSGRVVAAAKPVDLVFEPVNSSKQVEPTFNFAWAMGDQLLYALKDALTDASLGHAQGELKAIKQHLDDMRSIAFTKLNVPLERS